MSLKKIAAELGVSLTTVSRALNGYPEVAQSTRAAVAAAARRLNHRPDVRARSLALGRGAAVGLVFPVTPGDLGDPLFLAIATRMGERLARADLDMHIIAASSDGELQVYQRALGHIAAFVVPRTRVRDQRLALLQARGVPFVAYGRSEHFAEPYAWLDFDNAMGARLATERLIGFGHRDIAFIGAPAAYNFATLRLRGFMRAMLAGGLRVNPAMVQQVGLDLGAGYAAMVRLLDQPVPPTAVLVDNHLAGVGAVHAALRAGKVLGKDLSIIVYDGVGADAVVLQNAITAVVQSTTQSVADTLVDFTLARLKGEPPETLQHLGLPELLPGDSDGPAPT
jgi:LacI family transcriptional regulator